MFKNTRHVSFELPQLCEALHPGDYLRVVVGQVRLEDSHQMVPAPKGMLSRLIPARMIPMIAGAVPVRPMLMVRLSPQMPQMIATMSMGPPMNMPTSGMPVTRKPTIPHARANAAGVFVMGFGASMGAGSGGDVRGWKCSVHMAPSQYRMRPDAGSGYQPAVGDGAGVLIR